MENAIPAQTGAKPETKNNGKTDKGPMKKRHLLFLDLETTGLNPGQHEITEIGALLVAQPNFEVIKTYEAKVLPTHLETASPEGLQIGHFDAAVWEKEGRPLHQALEELSELSSGAILAGFNLTFDWAFLQMALNEVDLPDPFYYHRFDVMSSAFTMLYGRSEMSKFSLNECCRFFGVVNRKAHTALADAEATYEVFKGLMKLECKSPAPKPATEEKTATA
jgi:DNA polymerase III epsilon subunit-like protein